MQQVRQVRLKYTLYIVRPLTLSRQHTEYCTPYCVLYKMLTPYFSVYALFLTFRLFYWVRNFERIFAFFQTAPIDLIEYKYTHKNEVLGFFLHRLFICKTLTFSASTY
jgi:hypothetical protein